MSRSGHPVTILCRQHQTIIGEARVERDMDGLPRITPLRSVRDTPAPERERELVLAGR